MFARQFSNRRYRKKKLIIAVRWSLDKRDWDCDTCTDIIKNARNCDVDPDSIEYIEDTERRGCFVVTSYQKKEKLHLTLGKFRLEICPLRVITDDSKLWLDLYNLCKTFQCLPNSGGLQQQDNRTMQALEIILSESSKIHNEELKKSSNKPPPVSSANNFSKHR